MDIDALGDYDKRLIREAMLDAQTFWLDEAATAATPTIRTLAGAFADTFRQEADKYKIIDREGWSNGDVAEAEVGTGTGNESREASLLSSDGGVGEAIGSAAT